MKIRLISVIALAASIAVCLGVGAALPPERVQFSRSSRSVASNVRLSGGSVAPNDAAGPLAMQFGSNTVSAQVSPGATTYWYALQLEPLSRPRLWFMSNLLADENSDGTVMWQLTTPALQSNSIWAVVDSAGAHGVASPTSALIRRSTPTFEFDANRTLTRLRIATTFSVEDVAVLWVRPNVGAWTADVFSSDFTDVDASSTSVTLTPAAFEPLDDQPQPPDTFIAGDVVVILFPGEAFYGQLRSYAVAAVDPGLGAAQIPTASIEMLLLLTATIGIAGIILTRRG